MTDARVTWKAGLEFSGISPTGQTVPLSGDMGGFSPMEMLAAGLAGCTAMDIVSILQKKRQDVTAFEVAVHADRQAEHPKVFTTVRLLYKVTGRSVEEAAVLRAIELSVTKYCPAYAMLCRNIPTELRYEIFEEHAGAEPGLAASGVWPGNAA